MALNHEVPQPTDPRARLALNYAFDRQAISEALSCGYCEPTSQPLAPRMHGYLDDPPVEYSFDPERAKQLLAEVGQSDLTFRMLVIHGVSLHEELANVLQTQLANVRVTLEIIKKDATRLPRSSRAVNTRAAWSPSRATAHPWPA